MNTYLRRNRACYIGAFIFILVSTAFAVVLQFFKGDVLDHAIAGDIGTTGKYAALLVGFILGEVLFYYCYRRAGDRFSIGCLRLLKRDIFASILQQDLDQLSYPLISLAEIIHQLIAIKPSCAAMEQFVSQSKGITKTTSLTGVEKEIRYDDVSFRYTDGQPLLQGLRFTAEKGKKYLIKGPSGCGKTTAIDLLLHYYDVTGGKITIDGIPISAYGSTYEAMTVVRQEAVLFRDTLRNNLTMYGDVSDSRLIETLKSLGLGRFANVRSLDMVITENGANLSGGEKKRICLARALLRDTGVLILDEPLANLDEATAGKIEDLLLSISGKLLLVVSHQFSEEKLSLFDGVIVLNSTAP